MFCKNCGSEIKETEKFCHSCGRPLNLSSNNNMYVTQGKRTNKSKRKIIAIIAAITIILITAVVVFGIATKEKTLRFNLNVCNQTGVDIYGLYASESDVNDWEEDILGDEVLYDGETINVEFTITKDSLVWDFAIDDISGNMIEFYNLSFENCSVEGATLILEYDGYEGYATLY